MSFNLNKLKGGIRREVDLNSKFTKEYLGTQNCPIVQIKPNVHGVQLSDFLLNNSDLVKQSLKQYGAVLFRDFYNKSLVNSMTIVSDIYDKKFLEYSNRSSPRTLITKNIYTSTEYPASERIHFHSENSYSNEHPEILTFFCDTVANEGGQTPLANNVEVLKRIPDKLLEKFRQKGILYVRKMNDIIGLNWMEVFQTESKAKVEELCKRDNIKFEWNMKELVLKWSSPAISNHPITKQELWFNHAYFFHKNSYPSSLESHLQSIDDLPFQAFFGDGSIITDDDYKVLHEAYIESCSSFNWKKDDLLIIDNYTISHSRNAFKGSRKLFVSMI
jgi:hypothetical protein